MYRPILTCLALLVLARASLAFPAQLDYLLNDAEPEQMAKRGAGDDVMYRVQRSRDRCSINCISCSNTWSTSFNTHQCMKHCMTITDDTPNKYSCRKFYVHN